MSDKKHSEPAEPKMRKIKFFRKIAEADPVLDFCFGRRYKTFNYTLVEGNVYELPEDVIKHINSIKKTLSRSDVRTNEKIVYDVYYYSCEPVVD